MPALEATDSIRSLYRNFLSKVTQKSLNAFYYACSYAKADYTRFIGTTAALALKIVLQGPDTQPGIFCAWQENEMLHNTGSSRTQYMPLFLYCFRWNIGGQLL